LHARQSPTTASKFSTCGKHWTPETTSGKTFLKATNIWGIKYGVLEKSSAKCSNFGGFVAHQH